MRKAQLAYHIFFAFIVLSTNYFSVSAQEYFKIQDNYAHYINHPKAKGVDFKIRVPEGWTVKEGNRPNVVSKITLGDNMFMVLIYNGITFISRNQAKELYDSGECEEMLLEEYRDRYINPTIISATNEIIDSYPARYIVCSYSYKYPWQSKPVKFINRVWCIYYEDYIISLQSSSPETYDAYTLSQYYNMVHSIVFFEHYQ